MYARRYSTGEVAHKVFIERRNDVGVPTVASNWRRVMVTHIFVRSTKRITIIENLGLPAGSWNGLTELVRWPGDKF